ncbi:hypothetical protein FOMG_19701 [Fusarium oxysporum f. sp. melonis 26406]|uniref:BHLH domain-containing protein n=1 Tax=Fusarium oxysporum f. sp. melonis 26406 TaxID=1089452 RepID=W9ZR09_FUSOX|nr:hypothetical protein FOMG_19701 [Fusarium oxysporum f. sp. melonis 26406]
MPTHVNLLIATVKNLPWDADEYFASEYSSNASGSPELSDFLQVDFPMACQPSPDTEFDYPCHEASIEPLSSEASEPLTPTGQQSHSPTQLLPNNNLSSVPEVQLRSASRKPKNRRHRVAAPSTQAHARECHNLVEKQYRTRLKSQFGRLLAVLPAANTRNLTDRDSGANQGQVLSRGQVLDLARDHILELEKEIAFLLNMRPNGYPMP